MEKEDTKDEHKNNIEGQLSKFTTQFKKGVKTDTIYCWDFLIVIQIITVCIMIMYFLIRVTEKKNRWGSLIHKKFISVNQRSSSCCN